MRQVMTLALALLLLGAAFAAFTGYLAYCSMTDMLRAYEKPPREDAARLGSVLDAALNWTMRVSGAVVTLLGAALAVRRGSLDQTLSSAVVVLAGVVLITQHWAAGIALAVVAVAFVVGMTLHRQPPADRNTGSA